MRVFIGIKVQLESLGPWPKHLQKIKQAFGNREMDIRWTAPGDYHVTLAFLGEQTEDKIELVRGILQEVAKDHSPIVTDAHGMGGFPDLFSARVVWIGVHNKKTLRALQVDLVERLIDKGFSLPAENFVPHITVGRLRNHQAIKTFIDPHLRKDWGKLQVDELILFKSEVFGPYPKYTPLFTYSLNKELSMGSFGDDEIKS